MKTKQYQVDRFQRVARKAAQVGYDPRNSVDAHARAWVGYSRLGRSEFAANAALDVAYRRRRGLQAG